MSTLKVDTIQHSGGTTGLTIDTSGIVLTPARPAFRAYRNATSWNDITHNTWTKVALNATDFNIGSHYNTSTYRFTAPVSGVYVFDYQLYTHSSSGGSKNLAVYINGSEKMRAYYSNEAESSIKIHGPLYLNATDYAEPYLHINSSASNDYYFNSSSVYAWFAGYLLG